jgi:hypothetical protein
MDDIKDIQKGDDFSKFIDAQHVRTDPFGGNRAAERLYRRVERVCAALYLLTRHLPPNEPIREKVRSESSVLFQKVIDLRDEMRATESSAIFSFQSSIRQLISLSRMLTAGGFVSFQNADAIIAALDDLGSFVSSSQRSSLSEGVMLTREDLMGDTSPLADRPFVKDVKDRKNVKDKIVLTDGQKESVISGTNSLVVARAQGIIAILRVHSEIGIKEICSRLPDYSEKMIQRELAGLIKTGQVKKLGFKRWSKYSLAA